ncbi:MAG: 30S ribosomal protein S3 [Dehalococcoidia bacterium]|nr:30S ribosomal protein S3 [Dehalococcoidia bacterium]
MGQKTHPIGFRLGIVKDWQARWFAGKQEAYRNLVFEDLQIRGRIADSYPDAGISRVEIERSNNDVTVTIHTARPGIVIGRGGQRVEELRKDLEGIIRRRARLNVQEIRQPELDAFLVARNVADQLERRIAFRRAIRQTLGRTMQAGAEGIKIICAGRLGGADIARSEKAMEGRVPLHTLRADIDYGLAEAATDFGRIGVKVWIYKGDILPESAPEPEIEEEISPIEVTLSANPEPEPVVQAVPPVAAAPAAPAAPVAPVAPAAPAAPAPAPAPESQPAQAAQPAPPQPAAETPPAAPAPGTQPSVTPETTQEGEGNAPTQQS